MSIITFIGMVLVALISGFFALKGSGYGLQVKTELLKISDNINKFELKYNSLETEWAGTINYNPSIDHKASYDNFISKHNELIVILNDLQYAQNSLDLNKDSLATLNAYCVNCKMCLMFKMDNRTTRYWNSINQLHGKPDWPIETVQKEEREREKNHGELFILIKRDKDFFPVMELINVSKIIFKPFGKFLKKYFKLK